MLGEKLCAAENVGKGRGMCCRFEIRITTRCPPGLEPGTFVRLVRHEHGYWIVEAKGKEFTVFKTLIVAGFEYEVRGRWLPETDPEVQAAGKTREPRINANRHEYVLRED